MNDPDLYRRTSAADKSKRDTKQCLEEFTAANRWKRNARIIDVGCGDGSSTAQLVQRYAPRCCSAILGADLSAAMVQYADSHFRSDTVRFTQLDLTAPLPPHLRARFDHAFSFYTLNRIKDQQAAFGNIYELLDEGGSCLLAFLGRYQVYESYRRLAALRRWSAPLAAVDLFTSPYHDAQDPKHDIRKLMEKVGFQNIEVQSLDKSWTHENLDEFKNLTKAINPFDALLEQWDDFMEDYLKLTPNALTVDYQLIVVYGTK